MRRILLTTSIALVFVFFAVLIISNITEAQRAQRTERPGQRQAPRGARPGMRLSDPMEGIRESFWRVAIMMDTNDEQLVKIRTAYKEISKDITTKRKELQAKAKELQGKAKELQESELREQGRELFQQSRDVLQGINNNLKEKLKVTLTEEQFTKYEDWDKERQKRARRGNSSQGRRGRPRQRDAQPTPPKPE